MEKEAPGEIMATLAGTKRERRQSPLECCCGEKQSQKTGRAGEGEGAFAR